MMINVHEAKTNFSKLLEQAHAGQEVILSKAGKPYARLMPLENNAAKRKPGALPEIDTSEFFEALPEAELAAWESETRLAPTDDKDGAKRNPKSTYP